MGTPADDFEQLLVWAYRAEVAGEAWFERLGVGFADQGLAEVFAGLARLERHMGDVLRPVLARHGLDGGDDTRSRALGVRLADEEVGRGWAAWVASLVPGTEATLAKYRRMITSAPAPAVEWDLLLAHELAIQEVARGLATGEPEVLLVPVTEASARLVAHLTAQES